MQKTKIQWCDHTFNPWRGCTKISPGCAHCYAETQSKRNPAVLGVWGNDGARVIAAESYWRGPVAWNRAAQITGERRKVFCLSLGDVFEDRVELVAPRRRLGQLILDTPQLDWLLLTKRPENWTDATREMWFRPDDSFPLPANVWVGVSVEDQARANERITKLLEIPAAVRFLSIEPLLGPVDLTRVKYADDSGWWNCLDGRLTVKCIADADGSEFWVRTENPLKRSIDWAIIGGESGHNARPCDVGWIRSIVRQCRAAGVSAFVKQMGSYPIDTDRVKAEPRLPGDLVTGKPTPEQLDRLGRLIELGQVRLKDRKGGDIAEFPDDLRVREFPRCG